MKALRFSEFVRLFKIVRYGYGQEQRDKYIRKKRGKRDWERKMTIKERREGRETETQNKRY